MVNSYYKCLCNFLRFFMKRPNCYLFHETKALLMETSQMMSRNTLSFNHTWMEQWNVLISSNYLAMLHRNEFYHVLSSELPNRLRLSTMYICHWMVAMPRTTAVLFSSNAKNLHAHQLLFYLSCLGNEIWWSAFMGCWTFCPHSWSYFGDVNVGVSMELTNKDEDTCPLPSDLLWREPLFDQLIANRYKPGEVRNCCSLNNLEHYVQHQANKRLLLCSQICLGYPYCSSYSQHQTSLLQFIFTNKSEVCISCVLTWQFGLAI